MNCSLLFLKKEDYNKKNQKEYLQHRLIIAKKFFWNHLKNRFPMSIHDVRKKTPSESIKFLLKRKSSAFFSIEIRLGANGSISGECKRILHYHMSNKPETFYSFFIYNSKELKREIQILNYLNNHF
jgi:hypothetical protein